VIIKRGLISQFWLQNCKRRKLNLLGFLLYFGNMLELGIYCLNMVISEKKKSNNVSTWARSKKGPLYHSHLHYFLLPKGKNLPKSIIF
jgi:hypothetical protein